MNTFYNALYKYISPIFGYIMYGLYEIVKLGNGFGGYGLAIIMFTVIARCFMIPTAISQQKGMAKQQRLAPKLRRIQQKYAGDQQKIQEETQAMYKREGYSPLSSGCLPLLIQMPLIIGLFGVLYNPIKYAVGGIDPGFSSTVTDQITLIINAMIEDKSLASQMTSLGIKSAYSRYYPLYVIQNFDFFKTYLINGCGSVKGLDPAIVEKIGVFAQSGQFTFLGLGLGQKPDIKHFDKYWAIPILSGLASTATTVATQVIQKRNNPAAMKAPGQGCMMAIMPITSVYFTFLFPSGIGIYWIVSSLFATVQTFVINSLGGPQKAIAKLMVSETIERRSREESIKKTIAYMDK